MSIGGRFAVAISAVLAALSLAGLAWYGQSARIEARSSLDERISQHQHYVQHALAMALQSGDIARINAELDALLDQPDLARVWLEPKGMAAALTRERTGAGAGAGAVGEQVSRSLTLRLGGELLGEVRVDYSTARADQFVRSTLRTLFAFAVALVLAAGATAFFVARGITRPIAEWTRAATAVSEGADDRTVLPHGPPELVALGAGVERMRRFVDDRTAAIAQQDQQITGVVAERERMQAERDRLIGLIESTSDLVGTCDPNLNVSYLNRAGRQMTWVGERQADAISISMLHPEWAGQLIKEQGLPTALRVGTWSGETAVLDAQGREVPVSQVIACHRDAGGQVIYLSTIVRDITERKRAEAALQRSEARLRQALQASGTGVFEHDHDTDTLYWSPESRQMFGLDNDQPISFADLVACLHPDDQQGFVLAAGRAHDPSGDGTFDIVFRHIRPEGGVRWASCRSLTTFEGEGSARRPLRTTGAVVDITERRHAEEALRSSEGRLTYALRASNTGIYDHDHASNVIYWSPEFRVIFGWPADAPVPLADFVASVLQEDRDHVRGAIARTHDPAGDGLYDAEYRIRRGDGALRWVRARGQTLFAGDGAERRAVRTVGGAVDITERREAEEALRRSEGRLTHALRASNTGIYDHDHASDVIYWSPEFRTIFGWPADAPVPLADFVASVLQEDRDHVRAAIARSHDPAGDGLYDAEYRVRRGDGALRWVRARGQTLFAGDGADRHPVRTVGGAVDITERREAEEALRRGERRLTKAVQASNTGIFEHDHRIEEVYCSPEHRMMNGWSADQPITIADVVAATLAEDRDRLGAAIMRTHDPAGDGVLEIEHRIRRPDGVVRWLSVRAQTFFAGEGVERRPLRTVGGVIDITERREAEEALRRSELNYRTLFETMRQGVVTQDRSGAIVDANPAAQEILGLSLEQMQGRTSMDPRWRTVLPDGRDLPGDEHPAMVSLRTNRPVSDVTMGVVRPDEPDHRWILVSAIPRVRPGETEPYEVTATFTDITEIKRAGEQVQRLNAELEQRVRDRTAQLEATVRELESFSYSVSHDLRAPLRGIDGFSQALLEDFGDRLDDTGRGYLHRVRTNTQRMGHLIDDLLKLSRVTRAPLTLHRVDLGKLAKHALHQLEEEHPGHRPLTKVQPGPAVQGDPGLLLVALENLLGNAWKYSSRRTDACIEFSHITRDGETIYFVRDNGVGFDMKYASKLFGAFQRLHHQKDFEGTGIGLATVERIVSRHGGRVWAEAEVGQGATFYFTIGQLGEASAARPKGVNGRVDA